MKDWRITLNNTLLSTACRSRQGRIVRRYVARNDQGVDESALANGRPMRNSPGSSDMEKIARRWHDLAEQRLAYYTEMYRSGRWKHYYTQESFAVRMLDVIEDAKKWRQLAGLPIVQETARAAPAREPEAVRPAA